MTRVVGVHGVGHQFAGENTLRAEWLPALKDGLARAGRCLASDDDFACVFYGNLFRPAGKAVIDQPLDASDVAEDWERELLELWWREAARVDPAVRRPDERTKLRTPNIVQRALDALSQSRFFVGLAERALILDLKQVRRYLDEPAVRRAACASIDQAIGSASKELGDAVASGLCIADDEWNRCGRARCRRADISARERRSDRASPAELGWSGRRRATCWQ